MREYAPVSILLIAVLLGACGTTETELSDDISYYLPRMSDKTGEIEETSLVKMRRLQLVSTSLVAALLQIPELEPQTVTLQVQRPITVFGNTLVRALEDAGFGLQVVTADQGLRYVSYSESNSETDRGPVTEYEISVGPIALSRQFVTDKSGIYPSSLLTVKGSEHVVDVTLVDKIFQEQGGSGEAFISGTDTPNASLDLPVREIAVHGFDEQPMNRRTAPTTVFAQARRRYVEANSKRSTPQLSRFQKYRKTVIIFDNNETRFLGAANKTALALLSREYKPSDLFVIKGCNDADGENAAALARSIRVEEELVGYGVPDDASWIAPCVRANYRHQSDDSPVPVEVIHYQKLR